MKDWDGICEQKSRKMAQTTGTWKIEPVLMVLPVTKQLYKHPDAENIIKSLIKGQVGETVEEKGLDNYVILEEIYEPYKEGESVYCFGYFVLAIRIDPLKSPVENSRNRFA